MPTKSLEQEGNQLILHTSGIICSTTRELAASDLFEHIVRQYAAKLSEQNTPFWTELGIDVNVRPHVHHPWSGHVHHLECV
jgi:hypothetical protein